MQRATRLMLLAVGLMSTALTAGASAQIPTRVKDKKPAVVTDKDGKPLPKDQQKTQTAGGEVQPQGKAKSANPGEGVWANYDFVPGERVRVRVAHRALR